LTHIKQQKFFLSRQWLAMDKLNTQLLLYTVVYKNVAVHL